MRTDSGGSLPVLRTCAALPSPLAERGKASPRPSGGRQGLPRALRNKHCTRLSRGTRIARAGVRHDLDAAWYGGPHQGRGTVRRESAHSRFRPAHVPDDALHVSSHHEVVVALDGTSTVQMTRGTETSFVFDHVFPMDTPQADVFEYGIKDTVEDVMLGYNGTIFAYGQTGSGKTYTMMVRSLFLTRQGPDIHDPHTRGLIPRITDQIFHRILTSPPTLEYVVKVSFMDIYMERVRDLLARTYDMAHPQRTAPICQCMKIAFAESM